MPDVSHDYSDDDESQEVPPESLLNVVECELSDGKESEGDADETSDEEYKEVKKKKKKKRSSDRLEYEKTEEEKLFE
jgi:hypothetical protein